MRSYSLYAVSSRRFLFLTLNDSRGDKKITRDIFLLVCLFVCFSSQQPRILFCPAAAVSGAVSDFVADGIRISLLNILVNKHTRKHRGTKENETQ